MNTQPVLFRDVQRRISQTYSGRAVVQHWLAILLVVLGMYNVLPLFAPVAMRLGWTRVGSVIYSIYATQCHQMAQRSFFLFGTQPMYLLNELPVDITQSSSKLTLALRDYRGDESYGWKVAWSDRMVYMYGSMWIASLVYWFVSRHHRMKLLPMWTFLLFLLPMGLDGTTHLFSDLGGLSEGFRYDNRWLASLTNQAFPNSFYVGDALGSFNAYARMVSGTLFGIGVVWVFFPRVDREVRRTVALLNAKLVRYQHYIETVDS